MFGAERTATTEPGAGRSEPRHAGLASQLGNRATRAAMREGGSWGLELGAAAGNRALLRRSERAASGEGRGLPGLLREGVERLSGVAMDDVRVHYGSARPAGVEALAYTAGRDIYLGPGQERHLPHEAWHVVQQKQGRVAPTLQRKADGAAINDDAGLEREADVMGARAVDGARGTTFAAAPRRSAVAAASPVIQRVTAGADGEWKSDIKDGRTVAAGRGYLRVVSRRGEWALSGHDHTWIGFESVAPDGQSSLSVTTDLSHGMIRIVEGGPAQKFLHGISKDEPDSYYIGSNFSITHAGAEAALAKARAIKGEYDARVEDDTGKMIDNPDKKYTYTASGRRMFKRGKYINCARYAAKLMKAARTGNYLTRRRAGLVVHTPRGVSLGVGREWKQSIKSGARSAGSAAASKLGSLFSGPTQEAHDPTTAQAHDEAQLDEPTIPQAEEVVPEADEAAEA